METRAVGANAAADNKEERAKILANIFFIYYYRTVYRMMSCLDFGQDLLNVPDFILFRALAKNNRLIVRELDGKWK